jgi:hypothetical protein
MRTAFYKDSTLDVLARDANVAQFVSFGLSGEQRYCRILGWNPNHRFEHMQRSIEALLQTSGEGQVNIRSYKPDSPQGGEFLQNLDRVGHVADSVFSLVQSGFYTIVNESIDLNDGGVSGVCQGGIAEFAPGQTPRCVEGEKGVAALPQEMAHAVFSRVYGIDARIQFPSSDRVEFSLHPFPRGYRQDNTIFWEKQRIQAMSLSASIRWPNDFSRLVGDKVYGLLLADAFGFSVPHTLVLARRIPPFEFGTRTNVRMKWVRPCPVEKRPGLFTTVRGWTDPFALVQREDNVHSPQIQSILVQDEVHPEYSGALITSDSGAIIEGVRGYGDGMMIGEVAPSQLPEAVLQQVQKMYSEVSGIFGSVRIEWVFDGSRVWIVQLQQERSFGDETTIVPGVPESYLDFDVNEKLNRLRELVEVARSSGKGIRVIGEVGLTSHVADTLRQAEIPSYRVPRQIPLLPDGRKRV